MICWLLINARITFQSFVGVSIYLDGACIDLLYGASMYKARIWGRYIYSALYIAPLYKAPSI